MNSLEKVQKASKILYILTTIAYVCSIIVLVFSAIGIVFVACFWQKPDVTNALAILGINMGLGQALCYCICSFVECGFSIAVCYYVKNFYKFELAQGNPFDKPVAKQLKKVGIVHIVLPLISFIVTTILLLCFGLAEFRFFSSSNILLGIVYLVVSLVLNYGAELKRR